MHDDESPISDVKATKLLWLLYRSTFRLGLIHIVKGIEFYRCIEYFWFFKHIPLEMGTRYLDIGSWKSPLPAFLALQGLSSEIVDVEEGGGIQETYAKRLGVKNFKAHEMPYFRDEVTLTLPSEAYDLITCVSTIEHFENEGDSQMMLEIHRLLAPGGKIYMSVPYGATYEEATFGRWFERRYDAASLEERLILEGFTVETLLYFKDHRTAKFTAVYWRIPKLLRALLGRLWILFALRALKTDRACKSDASLCGLVLRKGGFDKLES